MLRQNSIHYQNMILSTHVPDRAQLINLEQMSEIPEYTNYMLCPMSVYKVYDHIFGFLITSLDELLNGCTKKKDKDFIAGNNMDMEQKTPDDINIDDSQTDTPDSFVQVEVEQAIKEKGD